VEFEEHHHVPPTTSAKTGKPPTSNFNRVSGRRTFGHLDVERSAIDVVERHRCAKGEVREPERKGHDEVVAVSFKPCMRSNVNLHEEVTCGLTVPPWLTFPTQPQASSVLCTGRDVESKRCRAVDTTSSTAGTARRSARSTAAAARSARAVLARLERAHLNHPGRDASARTGLACVEQGAFSTGSFAGCAGHREVEFDFFL